MSFERQQRCEAGCGLPNRRHYFAKDCITALELETWKKRHKAAEIELQIVYKQAQEVGIMSTLQKPS
jgi:hypothetical protein